MPGSVPGASSEDLRFPHPGQLSGTARESMNTFLDYHIREKNTDDDDADGADGGDDYGCDDSDDDGNDGD